MFKRAGLTAKYKQYSKSIKSLKNISLKDGNISNCIVSMQSMKKTVLATSYLQKYKDVIECELNKYKTSEIGNKSIQIKNKLNDLCKSDTIKRWAQNPTLYRAAAIGIFSTGPASDAIKVTADAIAKPNNLTNDLYSSPFDNMPPMRNEEGGFLSNLYNTLTGQNVASKIDLNNFEQDLTTVDAVNTFNDAEIIDNIAPINKIDNFAEIRFEEANPLNIISDTNPALGDGLNSDAFAPIIDFNTKIDPIIENIPEAPPIPDAALELANQFNALGEQTFASLGLGGWTPVGLVQNCFEYLHVGLGIPWWEAIAIGTLVIRFAMFPLVVIAQRNAAKMNNHLPQLQVIQLKMTEARQSGNQLEAARYSQELMIFMKEKSLNPFKNMIVPLAQMPIFVSFFMGLRQMANVPVDSLRTGGMFWFTDLTVPDQFFALPCITSLTLWATIELGTDSAKLSSQNLQTMKYVLRAMPLCILPFTVNFPGVILCYWVSSNFISLAQVGFLRIPSVRDYFKIEALVKHNPDNLPVKNKGFVGGIKDSWTNLKITKELEDRKRLDDLQFQRAGKGPIVKTYKHDPTKQTSGTQTPPRTPISAKKR